MENKDILVNVQMTAGIFRKFSWFDSFVRQKRWARVAIFAAILGAFAVICFFAPAEQSGLMGGVLLVIGLGLPLVYLWSFFSSVKAQVKRFKLDKGPRPAYILQFSPGAKGVEIQSGAETVTYPWGELYGAYLSKDAIYLYVLVGKAFILPKEQIPGGMDALWHLLGKRLPKEKLHQLT